MADNVTPSRSERRNAIKSRKRRPVRSKLLRLVIVFAVIAAVSSLAWMVIAKMTKPYRVSYTESKEITEVRNQIAEAEMENKQLKDDISYLKRPEGKIAEARKLGFVQKGEVAVVVEQPDRKKYEALQIPKPPEKESFFKATFHHICDFFVRPKTAE